MDPLDFLLAASDLQSSCSEAMRRSAISRGYYAVYNYIVAYLRGESVFGAKEQVTHGFLLTILEEAGNRLTEQARYEELGRKFGGLQRQRSQADYELARRGPNENTCIGFVNGCHKAIRLFDSCRGDDFLSAIWPLVSRQTGRQRPDSK